MVEKVHQEKLQGVQTRLTYGERSQQNSQTQEKTQLSDSESCDKRRKAKKRLKPSPSTTSRVNDKEKSKGSGTRLTEQTTWGQIKPRKSTSLRAKMIEEATGSPSKKSQSLSLMRKTYPNPGYVKQSIHLSNGSVTLSFLKGYACQKTMRNYGKHSLQTSCNKTSTSKTPYKFTTSSKGKGSQQKLSWNASKPKTCM
nr:hypothetical protein [Tanacetum cinerariifolium]